MSKKAKAKKAKKTKAKAKMTKATRKPKAKPAKAKAKPKQKPTRAKRTRRTFTDAEKHAHVRAAVDSGSVNKYASAHGLTASSLYNWRRDGFGNQGAMSLDDSETKTINPDVQNANWVVEFSATSSVISNSVHRVAEVAAELAGKSLDGWLLDVALDAIRTTKSKKSEE